MSLLPLALRNDPRVVMTLDAGGSSFRFGAMRGGQPVTDTVVLPTHPNDLSASLASITKGFKEVRECCPAPPAGISFAFPGPADYINGIITNVGNLPAYRDGVALGPMLADQFGIPTFINNDGDLFAYGEAIGGFLPFVNSLLEQTGNPKRYRNLLGITLGTGIGGGIVHDGVLHLGDNSIAGEIWLLRNKLMPATNVEESASIRAVRRVYAEEAKIAQADAPEPKAIFDIATGAIPGNQTAAREAFRRVGEATGDAMANALTLLDGLTVIGGGLSGAALLFLPPLVAELNGSFIAPNSKPFPRLASVTYNLEDESQRAEFLNAGGTEIEVPGSQRRVTFQATRKIGVGLSRLGTSVAIAVGAYAFALQQLDRG